MAIGHATMDRNDSPLATRAASRRQVMAGAVALKMWATEDGGISNAPALHQEPGFKASRKQVCEALTEARKFDAVTRVNEAMRSMTAASQAHRDQHRSRRSVHSFSAIPLQDATSNSPRTSESFRPGDPAGSPASIGCEVRSDGSRSRHKNCFRSARLPRGHGRASCCRREGQLLGGALEIFSAEMRRKKSAA